VIVYDDRNRTVFRSQRRTGREGAFTEAEAPQAIQWVQQPLKLRDLDPHLIHGSLGTRKSAPETAFWSVRPNCSVHTCSQQTDTQTTLRVTSVATDRIKCIHKQRLEDTAIPAGCVKHQWFLTDQKAEYTTLLSENDVNNLHSRTCRRRSCWRRHRRLATNRTTS